MQYIKKLPFMLSIFMSIIISIASYARGVAQKEIYTRMIISLILFFILGLFIRNTIEKLYESVSRKKDGYDSPSDGQAAENKENE